MRRFGRLLGRLFLTFVVFAGSVYGALYFYVTQPLSDDLPEFEPADAIICLGAGTSRLHGWDVPNDNSYRRAARCAELYSVGAAPRIVFTGQGNPYFSAAELMANVAREAGVPEEAILEDRVALSTIQNADYSVSLLPIPPERLILVSDPFHLPRARVLFQIYTDADIQIVAADPTLDGRDGLRQPQTDFLGRETIATFFNVGRVATYYAAGAVGIDHETRIGWFN